MTAAPDHEPAPGRWAALAVCLLGGFIALLDVSIVNVALPSIESGLAAEANALQWIVSGYALTLGLLLIPAGRIGDARGRRSVFMAGIALFALTSVICGLASSPGMLIAARLAQGAAGGLVMPQISAFIQDLFRGEERGTAFGLFGSMVGLSTAIGPLLGGALIAAFGPGDGWRAVFFVNAPIAVVTLVLAWRHLPGPGEHQRRGRADLDPVGVLLLGLAVTAILLPFIEQRTWDTPWRLALFPLAALLLAAWVLHERRYGRTREPVVSLDLFRIRSFVLGGAVGLLYFAGFTGIFFILTQYLQLGLGYSAWQAGLATMPFAVGSGLVAWIASRQALRFGRKLVAFGQAVVLVGLTATWVVVGLEPDGDVALLIAPTLFVAGLGGGIVISPNQTLTLSQVPVERGGSAGGVLQTLQRIGAAAGIAITGSVFYGALAGGGGDPDFATAFRHGLLSIAAFVAAGMLVALVDALSGASGAADRPSGRR